MELSQLAVGALCKTTGLLSSSVISRPANPHTQLPLPPTLLAWLVWAENVKFAEVAKRTKMRGASPQALVVQVTR